MTGRIPTTKNPDIQKWLELKLDNNNSNVNERKYPYLVTTIGTNELKKDFIDNSLIKKEHERGEIYLHNADEWYIPHSYYSETPIICRIHDKVMVLTMKELFNKYKLYSIKSQNHETIITENIVYPSTIEVLDYNNVFVKIKQIHRHKTNRRLLEVHTSDGHIAVVTDDHPMIIYDKNANKEKVIAAEECIGSYLCRSRPTINVDKIEKKTIKEDLYENGKWIGIIDNLRKYIQLNDTEIDIFLKNLAHVKDMFYMKRSDIFRLIQGIIKSTGFEYEDGFAIELESFSLISTLYTILSAIYDSNTEVKIHKLRKNKFLLTCSKTSEHDTKTDKTSRVNIVTDIMYNKNDYVYDITTESGTFSAYGLKCHNCCGLSLLDILHNGYSHTVAAPKHLDSALPQILSNFYRNSLYFSGALSINHVDTLLAPFIFIDNLDIDEVKQIIQNYLFYLDASIFRRGQSLFVNNTLDIIVPRHLYEYPVTYGGLKKGKYIFGDFQDEMDIFNSALLDNLIEGRSDNTPFTFPLLTINYTDDLKKGKCNDDVLYKIYELTSKFGSPYFRNVTGSLKEKEKYVHSMCCHLRIDTLLAQTNSISRGIWDIGYDLLTETGGSNVCTINLNRIGIESKDDNEYFYKLDKMLDKSAEQLVYNKSIINWLLSDDRYDISIKNMNNMFNIIGIVGGNESVINFINEPISSPTAQKFMIKVINHVKDKMKYYMNKYNQLFGCEVPPVEKASHILAIKDLQIHPECFVQNKYKNPYLTAGCNYPVDSMECDVKWRSKIDKIFSSGTVYHIWGDIEQTPDAMRKYIEQFSDYEIPYFTYSPVVSICPEHGIKYGIYINCPKCGMKNYVTAKIVGYSRPIDLWSKSKIDELSARRSLIKCIG